MRRAPTAQTDVQTDVQTEIERPPRSPSALSSSPTAGGGLMRQGLLLNATYEPLTTLPLRRAVCLVLREKAEVVHHDASGAHVRSASVSMEVPSVIRLRRYVRIPFRTRVPLTRAALMRRDNYRCVYC